MKYTTNVLLYEANTYLLMIGKNKFDITLGAQIEMEKQLYLKHMIFFLEDIERNNETISEENFSVGFCLRSPERSI